jgi:uncharacterized membrane protein YhhN
VNAPVLAFALLTAAATAALLAAEWRGSRLGVWGFKPLAAAGFVGAALASDALATPYGRWLLVGLALSWLGDVLLIPPGTGAAFLLGMASFAAAHLAFSAAFLSAGAATPPALAAAAVLAPGLLVAVRWLRPHLRGSLHIAVPGYVGAIGAMLALSAGAAASLGRPALAVGAALFALSDLSVARDRLVAPGLVNSLWGLPLYFAAQLVLALSSGPDLAPVRESPGFAQICDQDHSRIPPPAYPAGSLRV